MNQTLIICGAILDFIDDPFELKEAAIRYFPEGALAIQDGKVVAVGESEQILTAYPEPRDVRYYENKLVVPGMVDTHIHYPQTEMIASYGEQLLTWLKEYAFPNEEQFSDEQHAESIAEFFLSELLKNGTTTALVFGTVHPQSVDAFFTVAQRKNLRMIAGKVLMNRNCPETLQDTAESGYAESKALIEKWHGVDRLSYAVTPRFAPTSTPEQLQACGRLLTEHPGVYLQTHLSENKQECEWVKTLFPDAEDYLQVYEQAGLVGRRSVFAHGIHLSDRELSCLSENQSTLAHCPMSNLFIGSGLFNFQRCREHQVTVGMATDIGAGTSFSLLQNFNEAYKVQQLQQQPLSAFDGLYLNTLGGARALDLEGTIGNFNSGCEADFIVLDFQSTDLMALRTKKSRSLHEKLFALMMLGDDRAIYETWIMGERVYKR